MNKDWKPSWPQLRVILRERILQVISSLVMLLLSLSCVTSTQAQTNSLAGVRLGRLMIQGDGSHKGYECAYAPWTPARETGEVDSYVDLYHMQVVLGREPGARHMLAQGPVLRIGLQGGTENYVRGGIEYALSATMGLSKTQVKDFGIRVGIDSGFGLLWLGKGYKTSYYTMTKTWRGSLRLETQIRSVRTGPVLTVFTFIGDSDVKVIAPNETSVHCIEEIGVETDVSFGWFLEIAW